MKLVNATYLCYWGWGWGRTICEYKVKKENEWAAFGFLVWFGFWFFLLEIHHSSIIVLEMRTFCAWIFLASLTISYASVTNYSKTQFWKIAVIKSVPIFSVIISQLWGKDCSLPDGCYHVMLHPFFLFFLFTLDLWLLVLMLFLSIQVWLHLSKAFWSYPWFPEARRGG